MRKKRRAYDTLTEALRDAINESELSFAALERETGVLRQSLMPFARGEQSIRLDHADELMKFFQLAVRPLKAGPKKEN